MKVNFNIVFIFGGESLFLISNASITPLQYPGNRLKISLSIVYSGLPIIFSIYKLNNYCV